MQDYRTLNWYRVCELWAGYDGQHFAAYLAGFLSRNQCALVNRKYPSGRQITEAEARRFYQRCLRKHPLYPTDRPAKLSDLNAIRRAIREDTHSTEMI